MSDYASGLFAFEREEFSNLNWIPMLIRYRLDRCGLKLSLKGWQKLPFAERARLLELEFRGDEEVQAWISCLKNALAVHEGEPPTPMSRWENPAEIPLNVRELLELGSKEVNWGLLSPIQQYVLCKLASGKTPQRYFSQALVEFSIYTPF
jgi:hypothetical protein